MQVLVNFLGTLWNLVLPLLQWLWTWLPKLWNKGWGVLIVCIGIVWASVAKSVDLMEFAVSKLGGLNLPSLSLTPNSVVGHYLSLANYIFPLTEIFAFLIVYVGLYVVLFWIRLVVKLAGHLF